MLTDSQCRAAKGRDKAYKLSDARGLYLFVTPAGTRSWRWKYLVEQRQKTLTFGTYPGVSLAEARLRREVAGKQLRDGLDPGKVKRQLGQSFETVARAWHERKKPRWAEHHAAQVLRSLEQDAFPTLGKLPIGSISSATILRTLDPLVKRGAIDQAHRLCQRLSDIFVLGIVETLCDNDPASAVRKALPTVIKRNHHALATIEEAREFLAADAARAGFPGTKLASRLMAITAVRTEALRYAEPHEFEGLDGSEPLWRIPAAKMKLGVEKRGQTSFEFLVPLPRQAVEVVRLAIANAAGSKWLFPHIRFPDRVSSENFLSTRYLKHLGYAGRHRPHGWRSTFSTIMNERADREGRAGAKYGDRAIIDLMLAHRGEGVEAIYNRAAYLPRRRELAQEWADLLLEGLPPAASLLEGPRHR